MFLLSPKGGQAYEMIKIYKCSSFKAHPTYLSRYGKGNHHVKTQKHYRYWTVAIINTIKTAKCKIQGFESVSGP
jgi:hypothetical protein